MPDAMNFRCNVTMATLPGQNNNKKQFPAKQTVFFNNAIQIAPIYNTTVINCYQKESETHLGKAILLSEVIQRQQQTHQWKGE